MKALLIDDERLARSELRRLLAKHPDIAIVGEAANSDDARLRIAELVPDLLFLDIQMPGDDGFALLESLDAPLPRRPVMTPARLPKNLTTPVRSIC